MRAYDVIEPHFPTAGLSPQCDLMRSGNMHAMKAMDPLLGMGTVLAGKGA